MRIQMKKILSLILVFGILASSLILPSAVLADSNELGVTLNTNGGKFVGEADTDLSAGEALPTAKEITRTGCIFAGWYDNAELTGTPVTAVPADATGDKTYYAKWVVEGTMFDNFDGIAKAWSDWGNGCISDNTDAENAYSGSNSKRVNTSTAYGEGYMVISKITFPADGDGISFWVKSSQERNVSVTAGAGNATAVTIPAGETFVLIPWSNFPNGNNSGEIYQLYLAFTGKADEFVYVDNIGTYSEVKRGLTFNTGDGAFVTEAPTKYTPGMALPTYEDVAKDGFIFAGWYDNADFTGVPVYSVPENAEGALTYYAKWVKNNTLTYDFENGTTNNWADWSAVGDQLTLNTEANHAYNSSTASIKYTIPANVASDIIAMNGLMYEGDGIYMWIEAEKATTIHLKINKKNSIVTNQINLSAGKNIVALPWPANATSDSNGWAGAIEIISVAQNVDNTLYIDQVGTYIEVSNGISFETNGGSFVNQAPTSYTPGMALPTLADVSKDGYIFAGWYDNASLTGTPVTAVPSDALQDVKYYAKWAVQGYVFEDFSNEATLEYWGDYTTGNNSTLSITDGALKYTIPNKWAGIYARASFAMRGNGICFYIKTDRAMPITVSPNLGNTTPQLTVPAGESYVFVPWSTFGDKLSGLLYLESILINFPGADEATVYVDNIGTYSDVQGDISFVLNAGEFVDGYTAPSKYIPGMALPTYKDITKSTLIFGGWYDNAEFTGTPVYSVPNSASGNLTYYAKWVKQNYIDSDFEDITLEDSKWSDWSSCSVSLNTDAANAYNSSASLKYEIPAITAADIFSMNGLMYKGDGITFWVKAEKATVLYVQFSNTASIVTEKIQISEGENFVSLPWPANIAPDANGWVGFVHVKTESQLVANTLYLDNVGTYDNAGEHAFVDGHVCAICGAVCFDYDNDGSADIRDLVALKNYLTGASDDLGTSKDDNGKVEEADLAKLRKQILGLK